MTIEGTTAHHPVVAGAHSAERMIFIYEDTFGPGTSVRVVVDASGWKLYREGTLIAELRGVVVTQPASTEGIIEMLTSSLPQAGGSTAAAPEAEGPALTVQVAEDDALVRRGIGQLRSSLGLHPDDAAPTSDLYAAVDRLATKAQGCEQAVADNAALVERMARLEDFAKTFAGMACMGCERDPAKFQQGRCTSCSARHALGVSALDTPHPGAALLERLQRLEKACRTAAMRIGDLRPDTSAGLVQVLLLAALAGDEEAERAEEALLTHAAAEHELALAQARNEGRAQAAAIAEELATEAARWDPDEYGPVAEAYRNIGARIRAMMS